MCTGKEDVGRKCSLFLNTLDIFVTDFVGYFILILYTIFVGHTIYGRFYGKKIFSISGRFYGRDTVVDFIDKLLFTADLWTLILIVADFLCIKFVKYNSLLLEGPLYFINKNQFCF